MKQAVYLIVVLSKRTTRIPFCCTCTFTNIYIYIYICPTSSRSLHLTSFSPSHLTPISSACDSGRGAVFFSIARGKVAEGIDFDNVSSYSLLPTLPSKPNLAVTLSVPLSQPTTPSCCNASLLVTPF